jgi:hypothetical protein
VGTVGIAPTILNMVGVDGGKYGMSGGSLIPDMTGAPCDPEREIVSEIRYGRLRPPNVRALIGNRYKLMQNVNTGSYRLYDIEKDPRERRNLARKKPERLKEMKQRLLSWIEVYSNKELVSIIKDLTFDELPDHAEPVSARFANGMELVGIDFGEREVSRNVIPPLQVFMRTDRRIAEDCWIDFYLFDEDDEVRFHSSHPPVNGTFPVLRWPRGRIVNDTFVFELKRKQMKGGKLGVGTYYSRVGVSCDEVPVNAVSGTTDGEGRVPTGEFRVMRAKPPKRISKGEYDGN